MLLIIDKPLIQLALITKVNSEKTLKFRHFKGVYLVVIFDNKYGRLSEWPC